MIEKGVKIGDLLVQEGLIDPMQLRAALGHQKRWGGKIGKVVVDLGFIEEDAMLRFLSVHFKLKAVNLLRSRITAQTFETVPENVAKKYQVVPVVVREVGGKKTIVLAMNDPTDLRAIDEITFLTGAKIEPVLATDSAIAKVLSRYGDFTPEATEYHFQEQATPVQLRQERKDAAKSATPEPPVRTAPPQPAPRPAPPQQRPAAPAPPPAREEALEPPPDDELELIKGEVTMLRTTKPGARKPAAPLRPAIRPAHPDSSPILGRPDAPKPRPDATSPLLARPTPPSPEPAPPVPDFGTPPEPEPPEISPLEEPPAPLVEALPLEDAPPLPDLAPIPEVAPLPDDLTDSSVLLQAAETEEPPSVDGPPPAVDFLNDVAEAADLTHAADNGMEIPDAGEEMQLADAYEFIPPAPAPEEEPPDRPTISETPTEPAGPPPFDADSIPAVISEPTTSTPTVPPEIEWGHPGDDFFSMPVPGGLTDKPEAMPDLPTLSPEGSAPSPLDEEWPPMPEPGTEPNPAAPAPELSEISPVEVETSTEASEDLPTISPDLLEPVTNDSPVAEMAGEKPSPVPRPPSVTSPPTAEADDFWATPTPPADLETTAPPPTAGPNIWDEFKAPEATPPPPPDESTDLWGELAPPSPQKPAPETTAPPQAPPPLEAPESVWGEEKAALKSTPPPPVDDLWAGQAVTASDDLWTAEPTRTEPAKADAEALPDLEWSHDAEPPAPAPEVVPPDWEHLDAPTAPPTPPPETSEALPWEELESTPPATPEIEPPPELAPPDWGHLDEVPAPPAPAAPDVANDVLPWEELEPAPSPAPPSPPVDLMVEEIGNLNAEPEPPPPARPSSPLAFEAPPPDMESDLPVIEAMPLKDALGESKPGFEIIAEPVPGDQSLPPLPDSDELVTEIPAFDRTVLKMQPVTLGDETPAVPELPETVLVPPHPSPPLPPPPPKPPSAPASQEREADLPPLPPPPPARPSAAASLLTSPPPPAEPEGEKSEPADETTQTGELRSVVAAPDESPEIESTRAELEKLEDLGEGFLDTREVRDKLSRISDLEREIKAKEFQFDDLLSLMMKKELGEITQELFMKELSVLKKKMDESRRKGGS